MALELVALAQLAVGLLLAWKYQRAQRQLRNQELAQLVFQYQQSEYLAQVQLKNQDLMEQVQRLNSRVQELRAQLEFQLVVSEFQQGQTQADQEQAQCRCNNKEKNQ